MEIDREAQHRYERKVSWGVRVGDHSELWTNVAAPVMTRLRQPQRLVLDTLVDAGVARSRSEALAWCVRLVGQHEEDWLGELREAMDSGRRRPQQGPGRPDARYRPSPSGSRGAGRRADHRLPAAAGRVRVARQLDVRRPAGRCAHASVA